VELGIEAADLRSGWFLSLVVSAWGVTKMESRLWGATYVFPKTSIILELCG